MWKDWLAFSRNEQYGIIFLAVLIGLFLIMRIVMPIVWNNSEVERVDGIDQYFEITDNPSSFDASGVKPDKEDEKYHLKPFNPNRVSVTSLSEMGFSSYVIVNWMKFLEAGGRFNRPEDVGKIYGIDSLLVLRLNQFIDLDDNNSFQKRKSHYSFNDENRASHQSQSHQSQSGSYSDYSNDEESFHISPSRTDENQSHFRININKASVLDFQQIRGIGEVFSSRIVAFRELLGGFYQVEQMTEVYGISDELFSEIRDHLIIEDDPLQKINVNKASLRQLRNHPYVNFYQARDIVEFRKEQGLIDDPKVLRSFSSFDEVSLEKILPYLSFNDREAENKQKIEN